MRPQSLQAWDTFCKQVVAQGGEVLEPEWLGKDTPHRCRCAEGHECKPCPGNVRAGHGICSTCSHKTQGRKRAWQAWDDFRRRISELGGKVLEKEWLGCDNPHLCLCSAGHECWPWPNSVQQGQGICGICAHRNNAANIQSSLQARDKFYNQISDLGGTVLDLEWRGGNNESYLCRCVNGHECRPRPGNVQQGRGICSICAGNNFGASKESFYQKIAELDGVVLEPKWLGGKEPHLCLCARKHECTPTPNNVLRGQGICKICAWLEQDVLYIVRNPVKSWIKFGISGRDGSQRLKDHRRNGFIEVIYLVDKLPAGTAISTEQRIKVMLKAVGIKPVYGNEYFRDEYLTQILELMPIQL